MIITWGESFFSSEDPSFLGPLSGLMKLLRSKEVILSVLASLGARGRRRLQPSVREGSCSQNPRDNWCTFMLPMVKDWKKEIGNYIEGVKESGICGGAYKNPRPNHEARLTWDFHFFKKQTKRQTRSQWHREWENERKQKKRDGN